MKEIVEKHDFQNKLIKKLKFDHFFSVKIFVIENLKYDTIVFSPEVAFLILSSNDFLKPS